MQMKRITKTKDRDVVSSALAAVALQDHLISTLSLDVRHAAPRNKLSSLSHSCLAVQSRGKINAQKVRCSEVPKEYVLDNKPPPLTLAQRYGLAEAPPQLLTEDEWKRVKEKANLRRDFQQPCVICKEELGLQQHNCLQSFERFTGRKSCPMCRKAAYQTRVVHDGVAHVRHKMATV